MVAGREMRHGPKPMTKSDVNFERGGWGTATMREFGVNGDTSGDAGEKYTADDRNDYQAEDQAERETGGPPKTHRKISRNQVESDIKLGRNQKHA